MNAQGTVSRCNRGESVQPARAAACRLVTNGPLPGCHMVHGHVTKPMHQVGSPAGEWIMYVGPSALPAHVLGEEYVVWVIHYLTVGEACTRRAGKHVHARWIQERM